MVKKILSLFIACLLMLSAFGLFASAADEATASKGKLTSEKLNFVVIGDNVSAAKEEKIFGLIKGTTPYSKIVGEKKSYNVSNYVNAEYKSGDIANVVGSDSGARTAIGKADVVVLSFGMVDFLDCNSISKAISNFNDSGESTIKSIRTNLRIILLKIKELNPDVPILLLSLYNPATSDRGSCQKVIDSINSIFTTYLDEEKPGAYKYLDLNKAFGDNKDYIDAPLLGESVIPSNKGHEKIAEVIMAELESLEKTGILKIYNGPTETTTADPKATTTTSSAVTTTSPSGTTTTNSATTGSIPVTGETEMGAVAYVFASLALLALAAQFVISKKNKKTSV